MRATLEIPKIPVGDWGNEAFIWFRNTFEAVIDVGSDAIRWVVNGVIDGLLGVPYWVIILLLALIALAVRSWQLAVGTLLSFLLIVSMGFWTSAMQTLGLVLVATLIAVILAVPLGIAAAKSDRFSALLKPVLDFLQTMPAFVYLIPAVMLFSIGYVPGIFATVIFAVAPGIRFTELGIRGVDRETVEAGHAFGAKPGQILRNIQFPLALPTIMAGINQVIMLSLSMVVLAGFVGANGLGKDVVEAVMRQRLANGIESGLSIVIIAIYLDRVTAALGSPGEYPHSLAGISRKRRRGAVRASN